HPVPEFRVFLKLHQVHPSEVFGAMNLQFEAESAPFRWWLKLNGNRLTAQLKVDPETPLNTPDPDRRLYFVGDLLAKGLTGPELVTNLTDLWARNSWAAEATNVQYYAAGQMIVIIGTKPQGDFTQQALQALRDRQRFKSQNPPPLTTPAAVNPTAAPLKAVTNRPSATMRPAAAP
ncbi:MAG TPA: hypothetical protein VF607_08345, partial [Verrucomicrobiae bacterium]